MKTDWYSIRVEKTRVVKTLAWCKELEVKLNNGEEVWIIQSNDKHPKRILAILKSFGLEAIATKVEPHPTLTSTGHMAGASKLKQNIYKLKKLEISI